VSTSRLERIIRSQHAWTYVARSSFNRPEGPGVFVGYTEVRNPVTDSALVEMLSQFRRIRDEPVSQDELDAAKNFLVGSFPLRFETASATAAQIASVRLLGLPITSLQQYTEKVAAVTPAEVQRVARQYLHPDRAVIVVVGDATQVLKPLEAVAPVTLVDVEGRPMDRSALEVRASTDRFDGSRLQPATLTYAIVAAGNTVGTATTTLARDGSAWVATQTVQAGPTSTRSEARFTGDFTPVSGKTSMSAGAMAMESDVRLEGGRIRGSAKLPAQMGGDKAIDAEMAAGTRLPGMEPWMLTVSDLAPGKTIGFGTFSVQTGGATAVAFKVVGEEKVTVPAGTFDAYKVELTGPTTATLWVRKEAPHITLKQAPQGQPVTVELQSMR
jgi:hypothetical protein